jgi:hypothetical protein
MYFNIWIVLILITKIKRISSLHIALFSSHKKTIDPLPLLSKSSLTYSSFSPDMDYSNNNVSPHLRRRVSANELKFESSRHGLIERGQLDELESKWD